MTFQSYEEKLEEALRLYWTFHKSFTQISRITNLSWDTVHDIVMDSIVSNRGFLYKPRRNFDKEEKQ